MRLTEFSANQKLSAFVQRNCRQIIDAYKKTNDRLYRGIPNVENKQVIFGKSLENREPRDTPTQISKLLDKYLHESGFKAIRSNSIFVTSDINYAEYFVKENPEQIYVIFPLDGFDFTWSEVMQDFTTFNLLIKTFNGKYVPENQPEIVYKRIKEMGSSKFVRTFRYRKDRLLEAINSEKEIMIHGRYVAIRTDSMYLLDGYWWNK